VKCSDVRCSGTVGNLNGFKPNEKVVKCSEGYSNRVSNIRCIDRMMFAACVAFSFVPFFHVLLVTTFIILCMVVCFVCFCLIVQIMYFYYVYEFLLLCV
jgi:hypothetical protein